MEELLLNKLSERNMEVLSPFLKKILKALPKSIIEGDDLFNTMTQHKTGEYNIRGDAKTVSEYIQETDNTPHFTILQNCLYSDFLQNILTIEDILIVQPDLVTVLDVDYVDNQNLIRSLLNDILVIQDIDDIEDDDIPNILVLLTVLWILCFSDIDININ